jgi:hypothetical protein
MKPMIAGLKLLVLGTTLFILGCASTSLNSVMADPGRYRDRDVTISGVVEESMGVVGRGFFRLRDGENSLWVYTSRGLPRKGSRLKSKGRIRDLASIDQLTSRESVPEVVRQGIGSGLVLVESGRSAE